MERPAGLEGHAPRGRSVFFVRRDHYSRSTSLAAVAELRSLLSFLCRAAFGVLGPLCVREQAVANSVERLHGFRHGAKRSFMMSRWMVRVSPLFSSGWIMRSHSELLLSHSSMRRPTKKRNLTTSALRGSIAASLSSASWTSSSSSSFFIDATMSISSTLQCSTPPPCMIACRRRARSISIRRIASCSSAKEMRTILEMCLSFVIDNPKPCLMDKRGGLKRIPGAFVPHFRGGERPQLVIKQPHERIARVWIIGSYHRKRLRNVVRICRHEG